MNTAEKYKDILHAKRPPVPANHPRMSVQSRAKIFSPFAALRGYDEKIEEQDDRQLLTENPEFSEEKKAELERRLAGLPRGSRIRVAHFVSAADGLGTCRTTEGFLLSADPLTHTIRIGKASENFETAGLSKSNVSEIRFEDIVEVVSDW